ncbi:MAG TPA: hypothetical protein VNV43_04245 [Candidatus Acidoferrales bacterium]|nr:hypothetical protein [Candidatus Acidoferrales bacterium]
MERWGLALGALPGAFFSGLIGWLAVAGTFRKRPGGGYSGASGAGRPVPVSPSPTHHLVGVKDLPPANKTHSLPKD